jgi:hypothetical protein
MLFDPNVTGNGLPIVTKLPAAPLARYITSYRDDIFGSNDVVSVLYCAI